MAIGKVNPEGTGYPPETGYQESVAVPKDFFVQLLATFNATMKESMKAVVDAIKTPPVDPVKQAQKERAEKTKANAEKAFWDSLANRSRMCSHLREDGSSAIAWAQQSDTYADHPELCQQMKLNPQQAVANIWRGTCQHCQTLFSPIKEECVTEEIWQSYAQWRRTPTQRGSVMFIA